MEYSTFTRHLRNKPSLPAYDLVKRIVQNASGVDEILMLPQAHWDYVDWLVEVIEIDLNEWIVACDQNRGDKSLAENFMYWLWWDECDRFRHRYKTPNLYPPMGYEGWGDDPYYIRDS